MLSDKLFTSPTLLKKLTQFFLQGFNQLKKAKKTTYGSSFKSDESSNSRNNDFNTSEKGVMGLCQKSSKIATLLSNFWIHHVRLMSKKANKKKKGKMKGSGSDMIKEYKLHANEADIHDQQETTFQLD